MTTDLIKNTGIQFISIPLKINDEDIRSVVGAFTEEIEGNDIDNDLYSLIPPYHWKEEDLYIKSDSINVEAYDSFGNLNPENIKRDYIKAIDEEKIYKVRGTEAMEVCLNHWIPLPFFRIKRDPLNPFHQGPENWCRANLQECFNEDTGKTHVLTLAIDTTVENIESGEQYMRPRDIDANDSGSERFKCVLDPKHAEFFFSGDMLLDWMHTLYWSSEIKQNSNDKLRFLAVYHVFLQLLHKVEAFPEIELLAGENSIDIGLTLDIGNSRTCGLIHEKNRPYDNGPFDFTNARKLRIRNLSKPHLLCDEPFEMQVAFADESFGGKIDEVHNWPSLVRVGPEAVELTSIFESEDSQATMSSPKRYLWDKQPVKSPWIKVGKGERFGNFKNVDIRKYALYGIASQVTSDGKRVKNDHEGGAVESRFSRSSLMMFAIYEILLQALAQINSHELRKELGNSTYRRVLKDVVLTCPTAMTDQEQYELRNAAKEAVELIKTTVGEDLKIEDIAVHPDLPSLDPLSSELNPWKYDEATCSQLAYLYGEIVHKYNGQKELFFSIKGKLREDENARKASSINMASIDIGGGTTDLMICNYSYDASANVPVITPKPLFWEGFNVAGDDIIKRLIEFIFIPGIHDQIINEGGKAPNSVLNELFGPDIGGQTATERIYRKQLANQVASSFAYEAMKFVIANPNNSDVITLDNVFENHPKPLSSLLGYVNKKIAKETGLDVFDICKVSFSLNSLQINHGISDVINPVMDQLSYLIAQFDCDIILLSGRPSRIPVISDLLSSSLRFSPDKIVKLGDYRFGHWYPFSDPNGFVNDPKSTVCVGALIAFLNSSGNLPNLQLNLSELNKVESTAKYIGVIDRNGEKIIDEDIIFSPVKSEGDFSFYGQPVSIGMRQLDSEDWISSALYVFDFKNEEKKANFLRQGYVYPISVTIRRNGHKGEFIDLSEIQLVDKNKIPVEDHFFNFGFQTSISGEVHWKDSGSFIVKIEDR